MGKKSKRQAKQREIEAGLQPMQLELPEWASRFLSSPSAVCIFLVALVLVVFGQTVGFDFVSWDDGLHVFLNPYLNPSTFQNLVGLWTNAYKKLYTPLSYSVWWILSTLSTRSIQAPGSFKLTEDQTLVLLSPLLFHAINVVLHALNSILVFQILRRFRLLAWSALMGAVLFCLHPIQVETVAWVSGLRDLLFTFFSFLSIRYFLDLRIKEESQLQLEPASEADSSDREPSPIGKDAYLAFVFFVLAILSKPAAVVVPLVLWFIDWRFFKIKFEESGRVLFPWFLVSFLCGIVTLQVQPESGIHRPIPFWARGIVAGDALAFYLKQFFIPWPLTFDYARAPAEVLHLGGILTTLFVGVAGHYIYKKEKDLILPLGIFVIALIPESGLIPFYFQNRSTVTDHYLYFPMMGLCLGVSRFLNGRNLDRKMLNGCLVFVFAILALAFHQTRYWQNSLTLYEHAIEVNQSGLAHLNLGNHLTLVGKVDEAIEHYRKVIAINPDNYMALHNLAVELDKRGQHKEAVDLLVKALEIELEYEDAQISLNTVLSRYHSSEALPYFVLGNTYAKSMKYDLAIPQYQKALENNSKFLPALNNLANCYRSLGKMAEAEKLQLRLKELMPMNSGPQRKI